MKQGPNSRRARGRGVNRRPQGGGGNSRSNVFDSNGPDVRIRGNAFQVYEKYMALARDASSSGDRVSMENYFQHAEHYHRIVSANGEDAEQREQRGRRNGNWRNQPEQKDESAGTESAGAESAGADSAAPETGEQPSESELRGDGNGAKAKVSKDSAKKEGETETAASDESQDGEAVQA